MPLNIVLQAAQNPNLVNVDPSFLETLYIMIAVLFFLGIMAGLFMLRRRLGPAGLTMWGSKRKRTPALLHEGKDGILRFWNTARSFAGNWRAGSKREMTILPESKSVAQITKGPPMGLASANGVATLPVNFLYYADRFTEHFSHKGSDEVRMGPDQVSQYLANLRYREAEIRGIMSTINRVQNNEISIEDALNAMMTERGYLPDDISNKDKLKQALKGAIESQGKSYLQELQRISAEKRVAFDEGGWRIQWEQVNQPRQKSLLLSLFTKRDKSKLWAVKHVFTAIPVTLTNYIPYMPGATIDDLQTALLEGESAAKLERTEDKSQQFRWITLGIVSFIVMLGIYIVMQQMRVF